MYQDKEKAKKMFIAGLCISILFAVIAFSMSAGIEEDIMYHWDDDLQNQAKACKIAGWILVISGAIDLVQLCVIANAGDTGAALINCPDCGHVISPSALSCPNCGRLMENVMEKAKAEVETPKKSSTFYGTAESFEKLPAWKQVELEKEAEVIMNFKRVTCPGCGAVQEKDQAYCAECGARLKVQEKKCPACGTEYSEKQKFCTRCGAAL